MCFFKKKKPKEIIKGLYEIGDNVNFPFKGEMAPGIIYDIHRNEEGAIVYDVQIGGECPAVIRNVKESLIHPIHRPK